MIELKVGKYTAYVDDDMCWLQNYTWLPSRKWNTVYAYRIDTSSGRPVARRLHREVLGLPPSRPIVDHINGNGLDCRRENLRTCDHETNVRNVSGPTRANKTGFRGVSLIPSTGRYRARIGSGTLRVNLGVFETAEMANKARLIAEQGLWGVQPRRAEAFESLPSGEAPERVVHQRWSEYDLSFLCEHYRRKGAKYVALALGRSVKAVYGKAHTPTRRLT